MMDLTRILAKAVARPRALSAEELEFLIDLDDPVQIREMQTAAYALKCRHCGKVVSMRGLVELGNVCAKDCLYCGIRHSNATAERYRLTDEQILSCCAQGHALGFRTFVMQGGEDSKFTDERMVALIRQIKRQYPDSAITLSLGERKRDSYQRRVPTAICCATRPPMPSIMASCIPRGCRTPSACSACKT